MDKHAILKAVITALKKDLASLELAQAAAYQAATHEENKAEDQYDTRGLEASYLAGAQTVRIQELANMIHTLENFSPKNFTDDSHVAIGALLELGQENRSQWYFLLPYGAGVKVKVGKDLITVVTPESPLGKALIGRTPGDECILESPGGKKTYILDNLE